jgi:4-amino-4-deoxy-L-arabinose transferase and related glycosyltransferases of PMT family
MFHNWVDANAYFTVGKGIFHGIVPYKDLFDHKGPLVYFLNGIGSWISYKTFYGVFLIQGLSLAITLYYAYKTAEFQLKKSSALWVALVLPIFLLFSRHYSSDCPEEFVWPFLSISFYHFMSFFVNSTSHKYSPRMMLWHGFAFGCIIMLKFNLIGFWVGGVSVILLKFILDKEYVKCLSNILMFLLGCFLALFPYLLYAISTHSLQEAIHTYIYFNLLYARDVSVSSSGVLKTLYSILRSNRYVALCIFVGFWYLVKKENHITKMGKWAIILSFILGLLCTYGGGRKFGYYFIPFSFFSLYGIIALFKMAPAISLDKRKTVALVSAILIAVPFFNGFQKHKDIFRLTGRETVQQSFAKLINQENNATLFCYNMMDQGFYNAAGIIPNERYFYMPNISYNAYPVIYESQLQAVKSKKAMFIIMIASPENEKLLNDDYVSIAKKSQKHFDNNRIETFELFKLKDS